jgi:hypothetical protein
MPASVNLHPHLIPTIITEERLKSYKSVFEVKSDLELVGVYLWNLNACANLYPLLNHVEITIRNLVDQALTQHLGRFWWSAATLPYKSFVAGGPVPDVVKSIRGNFKSATKTVEREKRDRYGVHAHFPTHDEIVAGTEFSTWEYIFDREFMTRGSVWPLLLGSVLKGSWPYTKAGKTIDAVRRDIETVRRFRNRLSHHEPVWKMFAVLNEQDAINYVNGKIDAVEKLINVFSPDSYLMLQRNGLFARARLACSISELERFKYRTRTYNVKSFSGIVRAVGANSGAIANIKVYTDRRRNFLLVPHDI